MALNGIQKSGWPSWLTVFSFAKPRHSKFLNVLSQDNNLPFINLKD
jgi:hypothetical protein